MTTGTYNFVSFILNVAFVGLLIAATAGSVTDQSHYLLLASLLVITQFSDQVKIRFISQLINGISNVLQKLLKCLNGTTISSSFSIFLPSDLPVMLVF